MDLTDLCAVLATACLGLLLVCLFLAAAWWEVKEELDRLKEEYTQRWVEDRKRESVRRWLSRN